MTPKLGDAVAEVTKAVGIQPCGGCKQRQESLNRQTGILAEMAAKGLIRLARGLDGAAKK